MTLPTGTHVLPDADAVAREAAERLIAACGEAEGERIAVCLSGGSTRSASTPSSPGRTTPPGCPGPASTGSSATTAPCRGTIPAATSAWSARPSATAARSRRPTSTSCPPTRGSRPAPGPMSGPCSTSTGPRRWTRPGRSSTSCSWDSARTATRPPSSPQARGEGGAPPSSSGAEGGAGAVRAAPLAHPAGPALARHVLVLVTGAGKREPLSRLAAGEDLPAATSAAAGGGGCWTRRRRGRSLLLAPIPSRKKPMLA